MIYRDYLIDLQSHTVLQLDNYSVNFQKMDSQSQAQASASAKPKGGAEKIRQAKRRALEQHAGQLQKIANFCVSKLESTDIGPSCSSSAIMNTEQKAADSTELDYCDILIEVEQAPVTEKPTGKKTKT